MLVPTITTGFHVRPISEVTITTGWIGPPPRIPKPTEEEIEACPTEFRCFVCQCKKGNKTDFAGEIRFQYICRSCWPLTSDSEIRGFINFDLRHGQQVRGYPRPKFLKMKRPDDKRKLSPELQTRINDLGKKKL